MVYKVHFTLTIRNLDASRAVTGYKELTMPFVPFIGLRLMERLGPSQSIVSVTWSDKDQMFFCHIEDREMETEDIYDIDLEFLIKNAIRNNWLEFEPPNDKSQ